MTSTETQFKTVVNLLVTRHFTAIVVYLVQCTIALINVLASQTGVLHNTCRGFAHLMAALDSAGARLLRFHGARSRRADKLVSSQHPGALDSTHHAEE